MQEQIERLKQAIEDNKEETKQKMLELRWAQTQDQYEEISEIIRLLFAEYDDLKYELKTLNSD